MIVLTGTLSEYYLNEFTNAASELGIELKFIDPSDCNIIFGNPSKLYKNNGEEILADAFFLRATNTKYREYAYISRALESQGCIMLDPIDRFTGNKPNKDLSSIKRATTGVGVKTLKITNEFIRANPSIITPLLPIFVKPNNGNQNVGLALANTIDELIALNINDNILQPKVVIDDEYRLLAYNYGGGRITPIGVTHKKTIGLMGRNPNKARPSQNTIDKLCRFINSNEYTKNNTGLFGYDIAKLSDGTFVLIEANRSPMWERTERLRANNVAKDVLLILKEQYDARNTGRQ